MLCWFELRLGFGWKVIKCRQVPPKCRQSAAKCRRPRQSAARRRGSWRQLAALAAIVLDCREKIGGKGAIAPPIQNSCFFLPTPDWAPSIMVSRHNRRLGGRRTLSVVLILSGLPDKNHRMFRRLIFVWQTRQNPLRSTILGRKSRQYQISTQGAGNKEFI